MWHGYHSRIGRKNWNGQIESISLGPQGSVSTNSSSNEISKMNDCEIQRFKDMRNEYDSGNYSQALQDLRELASEISDPWDKAELLYNEVIFLVVMGKILEARRRVVDLNKAVASLIRLPSDGY